MDGQGQGQAFMQGQGPIGKGQGKPGCEDKYTLWVGNIPPGWNDRIFTLYFRQFGETWKNYLGGACGTNSMDQWGKVTFAEYQDAEKALQVSNGLQIEWPPGDPGAEVRMLKVRWYTNKDDKDEDEEFEELHPEDQFSQTERYALLGITGKKKTIGGKGWHYSTPRIPDHIRDMVGKGISKTAMKEYLEENSKYKGI